MNHLSEKNIQDYILGTCDEKTQALLTAHIRECHRCFMAARYYQIIFKGLEQAPPQALSPHFSYQVLDVIEQKKKKRELTGWITRGLLYSIGLFIGVGIGITQVDIRRVLKPFEQLFDIHTIFPARLFYETSDFVQRSKLDVEIVIMSVVVLIFIAFIDHLLIQSRRGRSDIKTFYCI